MYRRKKGKPSVSFNDTPFNIRLQELLYTINMRVTGVSFSFFRHYWKILDYKMKVIQQNNVLVLISPLALVFCKKNYDFKWNQPFLSCG